MQIINVLENKQELLATVTAHKHNARNFTNKKKWEEQQTFV